MTNDANSAGNGTLVPGIWGTLGEPRLGAQLENAGFEWVCLDGQHGHYDDRAVRETFALRKKHQVPVLVRTLWNDHALIGRALDAGADGVIVPMVQNAEQAEAAVRAAHYAPRGGRSLGPMQGAPYGTAPGTGRKPFVAVMVESQVALDQVDEIAAVPDLDMIFVGPFDLSIALGRDIEEMMVDTSAGAPLPTIAAACKKAGIHAGAFAGTPQRAAQMVGHGYSWVAVTSDVGLLAFGREEALRQANDA